MALENSPENISLIPEILPVVSDSTVKGEIHREHTKLTERRKRTMSEKKNSGAATAAGRSAYEANGGA